MTWKSHDEKHGNWPVVYILDDGRDATVQSNPNRLRDIYVGESLNATGRLRQHLETPAKQHLKNVRVIMDERFNKSICLDLESYLIKMLAGDGANGVLNRNNGIAESNYYQREVYRENFRSIVERLKGDGIFTRSVPEIENSDLFKLSPFRTRTEGVSHRCRERRRKHNCDSRRSRHGKDNCCHIYDEINCRHQDTRDFPASLPKAIRAYYMVSASVWLCRSNRCEIP